MSDTKKEVTEATSTEATATQAPASEKPAELTIQDLQGLKTIIDVASTRGE